MLRTTKNMRDKYEKIQNYLFDLIPEKWEEIYLYASIIDNEKTETTGEMFFYYLPKSILKKKPVNVYEVPKKFNINETEYLKVVDNLYQTIKDLRQDFLDTGQDLWTNLTISIAHSRFKVEFNYDKISGEEYASYVRHVIWRYRYLKIGGELKEERNILNKYFESEKEILEKIRKEEYQTGVYLKTSNNVVGFDREIKVAQERQKEQEQKAIENEEKKNKKIQEKVKKQEQKRLKEEENNKNQILKM